MTAPAPPPGVDLASIPVFTSGALPADGFWCHPDVLKGKLTPHKLSPPPSGICPKCKHALVRCGCTREGTHMPTPECNRPSPMHVCAPACGIGAAHYLTSAPAPPPSGAYPDCLNGRKNCDEPVIHFHTDNPPTVHTKNRVTEAFAALRAKLGGLELVTTADACNIAKLEEDNAALRAEVELEKDGKERAVSNLKYARAEAERLTASNKAVLLALFNAEAERDAALAESDAWITLFERVVNVLAFADLTITQEMERESIVAEAKARVGEGKNG